MAKKKEDQTEAKAPATSPPPPQEKPLAPVKANVAMTNRGFNPTTLEEAWRLSEALSQSSLVPDNYKNKPRDCLIALDLAGRLNVSWLAIMQGVYSVHGRLGMESKLCTSLINTSGLFTDPLDYEIVGGDDAENKNYKVRAFAVRKSTGKKLYGPWITWKLIAAEGWDKKQGSKWMTIPDVMFHYRAASWFANRHCPEVKMGMPTTEEAEEIPPTKQIESKVVEPGNEGLKKMLAERKQQNGNQQEEAATEPTEEKPADEPVEQDEATREKVAEQKEKLQADAQGGKKSNLF